MIAEINIMKSNMQYVILILFIFALQMIFYTNFRQFESTFAMDESTLHFYKKQNEELKVQLASLGSQSTRQPASVTVKTGQHSAEPVNMSEFYFSQAQELYKKNKIDDAVKALEKIVDNTFVVDDIAKAKYFKISYKCKSEMNESCLSDIDYLITQHPESTWTGMSLQVLAQFYEKKQQLAESKSLRKIIKKSFPSLQEKSSAASTSKSIIHNENIKL